ncbi:MAG: argininosuccinate synthase [Chloroflexota bacterium]|nr:argininosuccinate synthase [Chloroflexota bacterium]
MARRTDDKRVVLAYSGGLDTSVVTRWLTERGWEVICMTADMGYLEADEDLESRAYAAGAVGFEMLDLRDNFARAFCFPALMAGALYEGRYPLATALARPLIAKALVDVARRHNATAVAHGCTGKGNDQVRFDVSVQALAPDLRILAPVREWELTTRESEIVYAQAHSIPITVSVDKQYSTDENLWGRSIEAGPLEDPWTEPPNNVWEWTANPEDAPDNPTYIEIGFERGRPVSLDGEDLDPVTLISRVHDVAGANGVGRIDMVEDRLVGIKSREVYEAPAATTLRIAHQALETLTLSKTQIRLKHRLMQDYADLIYDGLWFTGTHQDLAAFTASMQRHVTGTSRVKLYKGQAVTVGVESPNSLYQYSLATYDEGDVFDQTSAVGFIDIFGLPVRVQAEKQLLQQPGGVLDVSSGRTT